MMTDLYADKISGLLGLPAGKIFAAIELLNAGNTLPFIARYRKEVTGGLDEEEIRAIIKLLESLQALDEHGAVDCTPELTPPAGRARREASRAR